MNPAALIKTAQTLMTPGKGLLAMDESIPTCNQRFADAGIPPPNTPALRRAYRQLLVTTPGLNGGISGAILYDETIRQTMASTEGIGTESFATFLVRAGIIPGIKVDLGTTSLAMFPNEKVTQGLDGLAARAIEYAQMGARFAKWRAVITIGASLPTVGCIEANAQVLARYAATCQEAGLVPIVEPEVLVEGDHELARCGAITEEVLLAVFQQLRTQRVVLEAMILKPNMVLPGIDCVDLVSDEQICQATWQCLRRSVPAAVAGVAFLSGGQSDVLASQRLNAICASDRPACPWPITFSFARALQRPALQAWSGMEENTTVAQQSLLHRVLCNSAATGGQYNPAMEANFVAAAPVQGRNHALTR